MSSRSRGAALDFTIRGDQLEHNRIQLEHNLQNTELSFRLSSTSDEDSVHHKQPTTTNNNRRHHHHHHDDSSVEYPRHLSEPSLPDFPSFAAAHHRSFGAEDEMSQGHAHGWSYRTHDDDDGINPYGVHSMSTAAHHASALTLSAGLGGGRAARRDISLSGAEYDPDRPLHAIMAGVNSKQHSMFDFTKTHITQEPIVVDSTAELDRILESGHAQPPSSMNHNHSHSHNNHNNHPLSPISSSSPSASDSDGTHQARTLHRNNHRDRPKLSDHLRHVSFSPKRPQRSVQSSPGSSPLQLNINLDVRRRYGDRDRDGDGEEDDLPTPRAATRRLASGTGTGAGASTANNNRVVSGASSGMGRVSTITSATASSAGQHHQREQQQQRTTTNQAHAHNQQPDVRVHPATPSSAGSKFTRMARGITRELEATQMQLRNARNATAAAVREGERERNPFHEPPSPAPAAKTTTAARSNTAAGATTTRRSNIKTTTMPRTADTTTGMSRVYLPDVTGLTAAVESPAKPGVQYQAYRGEDGRPREVEVRLLQTLAAVQGQLEALEEENGISRRRVRELEMELEECKREVARERTRLFERERERASSSSTAAKPQQDRQKEGYQTYNANAKAGPSKGKAKERGREISEERMQMRYKEAVSEKKALEALITSLRSHLTRLTSELAGHSALLAELRALRDTDASAIRDKGAEIWRLREEVGRLAGEVEVLRGVVEEGLRGRRASREESREEGRFGGDEEGGDGEGEEGEETFRLERQNRHGLEEDEEDAEDGDYVPPPTVSSSRSVSRASFSDEDVRQEELDALYEDEDDQEQESLEDAPEDEEEEEDNEEDEEPEPFDPDSLSSPINRAAERTMRTDRATVGASSAGNTPAFGGVGVSSARERRQQQQGRLQHDRRQDRHQQDRQRQQEHRQRLVDENELSMIAAELEERRANRSTASIVTSPVRRRNMRASVLDVTDEEEYAPRRTTAQGPARRGVNASSNVGSSTRQQPPARPSAPTPGHATRRYGSPGPSSKDHEGEGHEEGEHEVDGEEEETPFPQIRGERLERLFFSAPAHNARTCTVCDRRRRSQGQGQAQAQGQARGGYARKAVDVNEDEGYEGSEDADPEPVRRADKHAAQQAQQAQQISVEFSMDPAHWQAVGRAQGLPAQTVVARVVRELEDDFTHYKSIYVELADQYKVMDAASDVRRRNTLAKHLREVVDILELKGDKIAALYDLLRFKEGL